ncbi:hypothetical protein [Mesorhizobium huakuii]|uniref:Uncharacterized protein n=1 Tax=Mesorhizobium huakuii TaxID=28104 RepID=A0A7G6SZC2_9HYPH|nr:hypothetical protein [Mesorhizobium huakuii]QND59854.1 hypothetical protein HB778_27330 [Mesorhizobium huakuii]
MTKDKKALKRCMEIASRDPSRAGQLADMLKDRPWEEVAAFACYCVQSQALNLKPHETAPAFADILYPEGIRRDPDAGALQDKMLAAGLSVFEPDPLFALRNNR